MRNRHHVVDVHDVKSLQFLRKQSYLLRTPPRSEALRHSGGESLRWTSATVTLYFEVELSRESLPGTEQKTSAGVAAMPRPSLQLGSRARIPGGIPGRLKKYGVNLIIY